MIKKNLLLLRIISLLALPIFSGLLCAFFACLVIYLQFGWFLAVHSFNIWFHTGLTIGIIGDISGILGLIWDKARKRKGENK
jgi:hypothetical protein